jgi:galactonate dehydratase
MIQQTTRRNFLGATGTIAAAGLGLALASRASNAAPGAPRSTAKMKITRGEPIMTGTDVFVRLETDAGIVGYGDATNHFLPYSAEGALKEMIPYLIGEDPERIPYLWESCFRRLFQRGGPATGSALAGIDQALWDIKGKAYGVPVYQLLGGLARTKVRVYGHVSGNTAAEAARQAVQRKERGLTAIRFRAFHSYDAQNFHEHKLAVRQQIEYLEAIRKAVGDDMDLILECHGRYDPEWAIELARLAAPYRPLYIEDPVRHENPEALKRVREHTNVPLAIGERYHNKWECREAVINQWVDYLRPDVCHCGGITEMMRIAALADVFYITLIPHNNAGPLGTAATMHVALAIPNLTMIEAPWANGNAQGDVVRPYPRVESGYALPLEGPGLGVAFDQERAKAKPFRPPSLQPRLNATDGSVRDF